MIVDGLPVCYSHIACSFLVHFLGTERKGNPAGDHPLLLIEAVATRAAAGVAPPTPPPRLFGGGVTTSERRTLVQGAPCQRDLSKGPR
jgi:hypothetical protein